MPKPSKPCAVPLTQDRHGIPDLDGELCGYPRRVGGTKCVWHWLMRQPVEVALQHADARRGEADELGMERARVPASEWPDGERWCSGCQSFVPLFYSSSSRCRACASRAAHDSHIQRTYDLDPTEYARLLAWQNGVCFICGQTPRARRLAVDHDHATGRVRGLICANNEWGCNTQLARLLNDLGMAERALEYVQVPPMERMRRGDPPSTRLVKPTTTDIMRRQILEELFPAEPALTTIRAEPDPWRPEWA